MKPIPIISTEADLEKVWRLYYRPLVYFAKRIVKDQMQAEDIVSQAFEKLLTTADITTIRDVKGFLFVAVKNRCIDWIRTNKIHEKSHKEILSMTSIADNQMDWVEDEMRKAKLLQKIYEEAQKLPKAQLEVFKAIYLDGLSTEAIARKLQLSPQTVLNQKAKVNAKFRKICAEILHSAFILIDLFLLSYFSHL